MMRRRLVWLLLLTLVVGAAGAGAVGEFDISIDGSYETPTENVTFEGDEFTVTAVKTARPGENLTVHVTAPDDSEYQINIYTLDEQVQDFRVANGNETVVFQTDVLDPGSYVVAATDNGEFFAVHPVVVTDYRLDMDVPQRVQTNTSFDVTVTLDAITAETTVGDVEVVFWNEETRTRFNLTAVDERTYETTVSGLANGTYQVYAAVVAAGRVDGEENVVGFTPPTKLSAEDSSPETPTDTPPAPTPTQTPTATPSTATPVPTTTPTPTPSDVITPRNTSTPAEADGTGVGFTIVAALFAILGGIVLALKSSTTDIK